MSEVALLAEGVDRNFPLRRFWSSQWVALLAEGVDRNDDAAQTALKAQVKSPSSRRAWIEIIRRSPRRATPTVALLAEGVDRNFMKKTLASLEEAVALLAEGVDRNRSTSPQS